MAFQKLLIIASFLVFSNIMKLSGATAQVLAPPSLPGQDKIMRSLIEAIEKKNVKLYSSLLSEDVIVFEDENKVAEKKADWIKEYGKKLQAKGLKFKVIQGYSSTGRILLIEYYNSAGSWGSGVSAHCCWSYDAVAYDIEGGNIRVIRRLRGGDMKLDGHGMPAR